MKSKKKLKVYYDSDFEVNGELDKAIEKTVKEFGYKRWASGCDLTSGVRDLAFDKIGE